VTVTGTFSIFCSFSIDRKGIGFRAGNLSPHLFLEGRPQPVAVSIPRVIKWRSPLWSRHAAELWAIKDERNKISGYIFNVKSEWDSLRKSTQRIYQHRLHEAQQMLFQIET
jgi:hypothetical protein